MLSPELLLLLLLDEDEDALASAPRSAPPLRGESRNCPPFACANSNTTTCGLNHEAMPFGVHPPIYRVDLDEWPAGRGRMPRIPVNATAAPPLPHCVIPPPSFLVSPFTSIKLLSISSSVPKPPSETTTIPNHTRASSDADRIPNTHCNPMFLPAIPHLLQ